jgi:hypothetical protein
VLDRERRIYDDWSIDGTFPIESGWRVEPDRDGSCIEWTTVRDLKTSLLGGG